MAVLLRVWLCHAAHPRPTDGTDCTARGPASYILVFTGHWSPQTFPKQYPMFRPPAQWSKLIGEGGVGIRGGGGGQRSTPPQGHQSQQGSQSLKPTGVFAGAVCLPQ